MLYVYYKADGMVDSMVEIPCEEGNKPCVKPEDNLPEGLECITIPESTPHNFSAYTYTVIDGKLVQGAERTIQNIVPTEADRLAALETAMLCLM